MKIYLLFLLTFLSRQSFSQSLGLADFDSIVSKQNQQLGLGGDAYRFIKGKIDFASVYGTEDSSGKFRMKGETFKNTATKEILWVEVRKTNTRKRLINCDMGYSAPEPVIRKMEHDLQQNGYKYKKRKKYFIKHKSRHEYTIARLRANARYGSEFDTQPEILLTAVKRLK